MGSAASKSSRRVKEAETGDPGTVAEVSDAPSAEAAADDSGAEAGARAMVKFYEEEAPGEQDAARSETGKVSKWLMTMGQRKEANSKAAKASKSANKARKGGDGDDGITVFQRTKLQLTRVPAECGFYQNLEAMDLSWNDIKEIPNLLFPNWPVLRMFDMSFNELTTLPEDIHQAWSLEVLDLQSNQVHYLPSAMESMNELRELYLSTNALKQFPARAAQHEKAGGNPLGAGDAAQAELARHPPTLLPPTLLVALRAQNHPRGPHHRDQQEPGVHLALQQPDPIAPLDIGPGPPMRSPKSSA
eukprot:jgi/Tetstr1/429296/TSEL_019214.t1